MTIDEARLVARLLGPVARNLDGTPNTHLAQQAREVFPQFPWRVILDRSRCRTDWILTPDEPDPREALGAHERLVPGCSCLD